MSGAHVLDAHDCVLVIVDFQQTFLDKLDAPQGNQLLRKACWLAAMARHLGIPVIACVEDGQYPMLAPALQATIGDAPVLRKTFYSVARDEAILKALAAIGRRSVVLIGFEADVCIAQSALGLLGLQYRVAVVEDVMYAPGQAHAQGLQRMGRAGITVLSLRALYYEWMADVVNKRAFRRECARFTTSASSITESVRERLIRRASMALPASRTVPR